MRQNLPESARNEIRKPPVWHRLATLPAVFSALAFSGQAFGGTITLQDLTPNAIVSGAIVTNSEAFFVTQPAEHSVRLYGTGTFTNDGTNTGDGTIRIPLPGSFTANQNDRLFSNYFLVTHRTGSNSGTVTLAITGTAEASPDPVALRVSSSRTVEFGTFKPQADSSSSNPNPLLHVINGNFLGYLEINWADGTAGDTLMINIVQGTLRGVEFTVDTVPEPSSIGLLGLGAMLIGRRRRRHSRIETV